jgi:electron transfer flavoprotein alpha subunit
VTASPALQIAVLVKQVPVSEQLTLDTHGRLARAGVAVEMNAYCRRAVSKGAELARESGGRCVVFTMGPPGADDVLREAVAWGADEGVLITGPEFAGADALATARALAAALTVRGPFDLVLAGRNSIDADTGQVGPSLAELLDLPFTGPARELSLREGTATVGCQRDDGVATVTVDLPAVISVAERLCEPAKVPPARRVEVPADRISRLGVAELGPGPWGQRGSPTEVTEVRPVAIARDNHRLSGSLTDQVEQAVAILARRGALAGTAVPRPPLPGPGKAGPVVAALLEPGRDRLTQELLSASAGLAAEIAGHVVALVPGAVSAERARELAALGADAVVALVPAGPDGGPSGNELAGEDVAAGLAGWSADRRPWAVLAGATAWSREVTARAAARLGAGLVGDATRLAAEDGRLLALKPAFGARADAVVRCSTALQLVTLRPGAGTVGLSRPPRDVPVETVPITPRGRVRLLQRTKDDDLDVLATAEAVVAVGQGVAPERYPDLAPLLTALGAELAATRKVTDRGWLPHARQIGITGRSVDPRLFLSVGASGKDNHMAGARRAGTVLAINSDPDAHCFEQADVGIVGGWEDVVPLLTDRLRSGHR